MSRLETGTLGPARAQWNDFVGTAAADDLAVADPSSLYQLAGLDPGRWLIVAVDLDLRHNVEQVVVYAFDGEPAGVVLHADLFELAETRGELDVVGFALAARRTDVSWLTLMFSQAALRLVARSVKDLPLVVTEVQHR